MVPISRPQFPQRNKSFSEDITSAILNGASVSSALLSQGWKPRSVSFLPICKFMPTLCLYPEHLLRSRFSHFLSLRAWAYGHLHIQDCVSLCEVVCLYTWHLRVPFQCVANYFSNLSIFQKTVKQVSSEVQFHAWSSAKIFYQLRIQHLKGGRAKHQHQCHL